MTKLRFTLLLIAMVLAFVALMADQLESADFTSIVLSTITTQ